jgi:hypothetical protein
MAPRVHSLEKMASHAPAAFAPTPVKTAAVTAAATTQSQTTQAPSFSAVFAQIAAAAAAAGTTVASTAPAGAGSAVVTPTSTTTTASTDAATSADADGPAGPLFGPNPWLSDPTASGPNGVTDENPIYFASQQTAQTVAQMLGGQVVQSVQILTAPGSPFQQNQPNNMVQLPNGGLVNPGFIADLYTHGWNQAFINQQIAAEVAGAQGAVNS